MITQKIIARTDSLKLDKIISRYGEDSMRQVVFIIVRPEPDSEEFIPITIPEDAVGSFRILKPSGNFVIVPMSKSVLASGETAFDVVIPASANTAKGSGYYDIRITSDTDKYYFTAQGDFLIDDNIISDEALEDVSEVNGLIFPDDFLTVEDHVAYIDDDTVSTDSTWSSNKINEEIEEHAGGDVSKTVSGNPVTFTDGASAPLVKCVTQITGSQDLHGYDKPWVGGAGKNKLPLVLADIKTLNTSGTWSGDAYTISGVTFTILTDSNGNVTGVSVNGTATENITFLLTDTNGSWMTDETTYKINGSVGGSYNTWSIWVQGHGTHQSEMSLDGDGTFTYTAGGSTSARINVDSGVSLSNQMFKPMIRLATETDSTFTPYSNICPITAYTEGEIEVRGKNIIDWKVNTTANKWQGTLKPDNYVISAESALTSGNWYLRFSRGLNEYPYSGAECGLYSFAKAQSGWFYGGEAYQSVSFIVPSDCSLVEIGKLNADGTISAQLEKGTTATTYEPYTSTTHTTTYPSAIYRGSEDVVNGEVTTEWAVIASYAGETLPGEWISDRDEYAPGTTPTTGAQVAYALATPTTSSVTPTNLPIKSLSGYNHIESSTGEMEVEYITERFQPLIDSIKQL